LRKAFCLLVLLVVWARPGRAQIPAAGSSQDLQLQLMQNPAMGDLLRAKIQASGLSPDQVRARLEASGYDPHVLDSYLGSDSGGAAQAPEANQVAALQALGIPLQQPVPIDSGAVSRAPQQASQIFGVDVFRRSTQQFMPSLSEAPPPDYKLGPGDVLVLILTGNVQLAQTLPVTRYGFILIPQVGQVYVSHLTMDELREVLYTRLGAVYSGIKRGSNATTHFDVFVSNIRANQIYVIGEVAQPGAYRISSLGTVLSALYTAGGVTDRGNTRSIDVRRAGKTVASFDLYDYLLDADTKNDIRLEDGDIVFVPIHGTRVQMTGAVRRPGIYELKAGETLADVVQVAAGFRPDAALDQLSIYRILPASSRGPGAANRATIEVSLKTGASSLATPEPAITDPHAAVYHSSSPSAAGTSAPRVAVVPEGVTIPAIALDDGDSIAVDSVGRLEESYYVSIAGMVAKPGLYPWRTGMSLRDLVRAARGPKLGADLQEAEIARLPAQRKAGELAATVRVAIDSSYLLDHDSLVGPKDHEVPLQPYDNVLILKQPDFAMQRTVVIAGEVRSPGVYSLRSKDERLADLIDRAGGLTSQAYPQGIRFVRMSDLVGRVDVDLPRALKDRKSGSNVVLQGGDSITIPEYQPSVRVTGAVNAPGSVLWKEGADAMYYVSAAGGVTDKGLEGSTSVRFANGEVKTRSKTLFWTSWPQPGPGSEIVVPTRTTPPPPSTAPAMWAAITQITASLVAIVALLKK